MLISVFSSRFATSLEEKDVKRKLSIIREELQKLSLELNVPSLVPYFGVARSHSDKKIEAVYGEANFAKNQIKDRKDLYYQFYSEADTETLLEEKRMEDSFLQDLNSGRFEVWYQPKFNPRTDEMIGAEGLVRWRQESY